jgi:hypothetical protein
MKKASSWSDTSSSNASSNRKKDINYMPKPLAIRGVHIFDPEHGGGRIRKNRQMPRQKFYLDNPDKIGYNC